MAEFKLMGRFIALSEVKEIPSSEAGKAPMKKRELYMDCTRVDYYTRQPIGQENKVLLDFGGDKLLEKVAALGLKKDDVIAVEFNVVGTPYKDKTTGKSRVFTSIRCYDVEVVARAGQAVAQMAQPAPQPQAQVQQQAQQQAQTSVQTQNQNQTDDGNKDDGLPF
jgi:hypothetical protein